LFTAGISEEEAHARATSSMMITVASASAPSPVGEITDRPTQQLVLIGRCVARDI
jgi:hypothetical protein